MTDPGYKIEPAVFSDKECGEIIAVLSGARRSRAGVRHVLSNPAVMNVAMDHRLLAMAREALGGEATPFRATL